MSLADEVCAFLLRELDGWHLKAEADNEHYSYKHKRTGVTLVLEAGRYGRPTPLAVQSIPHMFTYWEKRRILKALSTHNTQRFVLATNKSSEGT